MEAITLYELNGRVKQALKGCFNTSLWITAEITEIQLNRSGHCYLQLADKPEGGDNIIATARATIWAFVFRMLRPYFETTTGRSLEKGMKVMLNVEVVFHEVYGYSLNIKDIDPTYTVGDLERKKREILMQLTEEGIIDMNRELEFPLLPKNIAVISSPTAAGLGDFMNQLENNAYGYRFHVRLFPAVMQGEKTAESVISALEQIYEYESLFDVVVIIRGGGSQTDLGCFDSYDMAANIAQFPLPVIAGIGHERDETIADRVAHVRVKTPTAAAAFLIDIFRERDSELEGLKSDFVNGVEELLHAREKLQITYISAFKQRVKFMLQENNAGLKMLSQRVEHATELFINNRMGAFGHLNLRLQNRINLLLDRQQNHLRVVTADLRQKAAKGISDCRHRLLLAENTVKYVDPKRVLARGYSITRLKGTAVKDPALLMPGCLLETEMAGGKVKSEVKEIEIRK